MAHYFYKCRGCGREIDPGQSKDEQIYLCPVCGKAGKNSPLVGVLEVLYDYSSINKSLGREEFLKLPAGKPWLYPELWPLGYSRKNNSVLLDNISSELPERLSLGNSSLFQFRNGADRFLVLDETRNPTLSFKDRASSLVALKALQKGIGEIAAASTGNAGSSIAGISARLGLKAKVFVPSAIPAAKRIQIQAFGAELFIVDGSYDDAFDLCVEISEAKGWYNRNTAYNPLTIEGKKSAAYDIFISSGGKIPDILIVPVGDGVIIAGVYKGFRELLELGWIEKMPKLIAVQAAGSDALVRFISEGSFSFVPAETIADSISAGAPRNLYMAAAGILETGGAAVSVTDEEILKAQSEFIRITGILAEPSCAASYAGYLRLKKTDQINATENILLLITGNGMKDTASLEKWNPLPPVKSPVEWMQELGVK